MRTGREKVFLFLVPFFSLGVSGGILGYRRFFGYIGDSWDLSAIFQFYRRNLEFIGEFFLSIKKKRSNSHAHSN